MEKNHRRSRLKYAVSEVFSVILILTITVTIFVTVSYFVLSDPGPAPEPMTELHGRVKDNSFIIEPTKGEPLSLDTICVLEIGGIKSNYKVRDFLETKSKQDGEWNLGERATFHLGNFTYFKVSFKLISREKDFVLWDEIIQNGIISKYEYIVLSIEPTDIEDGSANLWSGHNFGDKTGSENIAEDFWFRYLAYGAAIDMLSDSGEFEKVAQVMPLFERYKGIVNARTYTQMKDDQPIRNF